MTSPGPKLLKSVSEDFSNDAHNLNRLAARKCFKLADVKELLGAIFASDPVKAVFITKFCKQFHFKARGCDYQEM